MREEEEFFERRIIAGLIVSKDFLDRIRRSWDSSLLESPELRMIADWCIDYYDRYGKAPDNNIESIYMKSLKDNFLSKSDAQYIETLLSDLSDEYGRGPQFNSDYLYDQTINYLKAKELEQFSREVQALTDAGKVEEAENLMRNFSPKTTEGMTTGLDLSSEEALERLEKAFTDSNTGLISYPGALGDMWNGQLVRGGFVSFLAPEKRGKTFMLLELAMRAVRQRSHVAFFEAGDMTESQILRRIASYMTRTPLNDRDRERFVPVGDCILNQIDECDRSDRNCDHGIFDTTYDKIIQEDEIAKHINRDGLTARYRDCPEYEPCKSRTCDQRIGSVWLKKISNSRTLSVDQAKNRWKDFFGRYRKRFKLANYPAGTLTITEMRRCLDEWERYEGFVPDVIVVDYADLMSAEDGEVNEFRHRQDHIWKGLRGLSQERHVLALTATQASADSYNKGNLSISHFSEDKRKVAHVTAQYGLNQDPKGREKKLGLLRINEIVVREGDFSEFNQVYILQDLAAGRPFLESFHA